MIIVKVFVLIAFLSLSNSKSNFMPNLPLGEFRIVFEKIYSCNSTNIFQNYFYLSKKSLNKIELKGNYTYLLPLDNTYTLDGNLASWDSIGGWKPNSAVYITKNACSNLKKHLGSVWNNLNKSFNIPVTGCPIPARTNYLTTGVDSAELEDVNLPKVFFTGKYKLTCKIKNRENKVLGRIVLEMTLVRPWEKPIWLN